MKKSEIKYTFQSMQETILRQQRDIDILCGDDELAKAQIKMERKMASDLFNAIWKGDGKP